MAIPTVTATSAASLPGNIQRDGKKSTNKILKSKFRSSQLRKIAKSARVNLNRYWGVLSHLYRNNGSTLEATFAEEMEQNRINELLESSIYASNENSLNSQHEEDVLSMSFRFSGTSIRRGDNFLYSSSSSISSSVQDFVTGSLDSLSLQSDGESLCL